MHETPTNKIEAPLPQKRGRKPNPETAIKDSYFGIIEEQAVKDYLCGTLSPAVKNELFKTVIDPCFRKLVDGVMTMPMFQKIIGISKEQLREDSYYHLIFQMEKFNPNRIGKTGDPVKAYSYYGTVVKNYILGVKIANDTSIANHGGMLDIDELGDHIPDNRRNPEEFEELKSSLILMLDKAVDAKRLNKNDLIVGNTLKYMLSNWHRLEFQSKNEFVRLLCNYTQLRSPIVARSLKKYKTLVYDFLVPSQADKRKSKPIKKVSFISTLAEVITDAYQIANLSEAKKYVVGYLETTKINEIDKTTMITEISAQTNKDVFHKYITNCLLKYEKMGVSNKNKTED